jgi:dimethylhistidine N-methyltransferase
LFDQICELDEYYLTRCEHEILQTNGDEIAQWIGREVILAELGSGSSFKTRTLLDSLYDPVAYVPIEISEEFLLSTVSKLQAEYPTFTVEPLVADFTRPFQLPEHLGEHPVCLFFPGSTIGNLEREGAIQLLRRTSQLCPSIGMLIGIDLQKPVTVLERAYDDQQGITAQFTLNLLARINRELGGQFDLGQFKHVAFYNPLEMRIEIYLESMRDQWVHVAGEDFWFGAGERTLTEYSHKYTLSGFERLAATAGFSLRRAWTDARKYFAVLYLVAGQGA